MRTRTCETYITSNWQPTFNFPEVVNHRTKEQGITDKSAVGKIDLKFRRYYQF